MNQAVRSVATAHSAARPQVRALREGRLPVGAVLGLGIILFLAVGLFHVWSRVAILDKGYELSAQKSIREELLQERKVLQLDMARLRDPARLERAASSMGLAKPAPGQIVIMKGSR
jgi:hypothetical protein